MFRFVILVAFVTFSSYPNIITAAAVGYSDGIAEEPFVHIGPQLRERRSPQLSGGGSEKAGSVRYDGQKTVWSNHDTGVDAKGFAQHSWAQGMPSRTDYGLGATVNHNLYRGKDSSLDAFAGFQRQWSMGRSGGPPTNQYNAGIRYNF